MDRWTSQKSAGSGQGGGFSPGTCMQHTLQADPTVILDEVSLFLAGSL